MVLNGVRACVCVSKRRGTERMLEQSVLLVWTNFPFKTVGVATREQAKVPKARKVGLSKPATKQPPAPPDPIGQPRHARHRGAEGGCVALEAHQGAAREGGLQPGPSDPCGSNPSGIRRRPVFLVWACDQKRHGQMCAWLCVCRGIGHYSVGA